MKNYDDYLKAVRLQCEEGKSGKYGSYFSTPSPAQLRDLCLVLFDNKLTKPDEAVFRVFFKAKDEDDLRKTIDQFDIDKFRPIRNFFTGKNEKTSIHTLNLIAVLVGYPSRPYNKFLKDDSLQVEEVPVQEKIVLEASNTTIETIGLQEDEMQAGEKEPAVQENFSGVGDLQEKEQEKVKPQSRRKGLIIFLIAVSLLTGGYVAKDVCFPEKQCMQWQEDHYEIVDCEVKGIMSTSPIMALDEDVLELKRVLLEKDMEFFKYNKPLYYYYKVSRDSVEFFNAPGLHPITQEPLKKISKYMIDKYVR